MRTVFLTGATGFIGRHLAPTLLDRGCEVRCLVRDAARAAPLAAAGARLVTGTLTEPDGWSRELTGCDAVYHVAGLVAGRTPAELHAVNASATAGLADACAALESPPRLVHFSSLAAAGPVARDAPPRDEGESAAPVSRYGESKLAGDLELATRAARLPITVLRPAIVFGPHDTKVTQIFQMIALLRLHLLMGFRDPPLSLIHVTDLVALAIAAADRGRVLDGGSDGTGIYHACDDREHPTYGQFGRLIGRAMGRRVFVWPLWRWVGRIVGLAAETLFAPDGKGNLHSLDKVREATVPSWACSSAKARAQLGFAPPLPLEARLRETADRLAHAGSSPRSDQVAGPATRPREAAHASAYAVATAQSAARTGR